MIPIPQYARSCDPNVVAAIDANRQGEADYLRRAQAFAREHGSPDGWIADDRHAGQYRLIAIGPHRPTAGQWRKERRTGGWRPAKSNPLRADLDAIRFREAPVPGLPETARSADGGTSPEARQRGLRFTHEGVAYVGYASEPARGREVRADARAGAWEPISAEQFRAALRACTEAS